MGRVGAVTQSEAAMMSIEVQKELLQYIYISHVMSSRKGQSQLIDQWNIYFVRKGKAALLCQC